MARIRESKSCWRGKRKKVWIKMKERICYTGIDRWNDEQKSKWRVKHKYRYGCKVYMYLGCFSLNMSFLPKTAIPFPTKYFCPSYSTLDPFLHFPSRSAWIDTQSPFTIPTVNQLLIRKILWIKIRFRFFIPLLN